MPAARAGGEMAVWRVDERSGQRDPSARRRARRLERATLGFRGVGNLHFRRSLPDPDARYDLTIRRDGIERTVTLTAPPRPSTDQQRLSVSNLLAASAWFVVATMIALFRPEQTVSRSAYVAGMARGFFMLGNARGSAMPWLPAWWRKRPSPHIPVVPAPCTSDTTSTLASLPESP